MSTKSKKSLDAPQSDKPNSMRAVIACSITAVFGYGLGYPLNVQYLFFISEFIQLIAGIPSTLNQTERYYDLTGSLTFVLLTFISLTSSGISISKTIHQGPSASPLEFRRLLVSSFVLIWAIRLGSHLFTRIMHDKEDKRFAQVRTRPLAFISYWVVQGLWVFLVSLPAHILNLSSTLTTPWNVVDYIGIALFVGGWLFEIVADVQKRVFRQDPRNRERFITTGVWSLSRHPNYAGEITLWTGIVVLASSSLQGVQWLAIISPIFTYLLLNYVSGIPLLEASANKKWGGEAAYQAYKRNTPVLWPFIGSRG